jgi:DHA2 family multidrug resistance protein
VFLFLTHTLTAENTFISRALFKDRSFVIGNIFIFIVGIVLFATLALLPPLLQNLMGYPVFEAGLVTAPRGIGTWIAMLVVGRIIGRVDARLLIAIGFGLCAVSLVQMSGFSPQMDAHPVVMSGLIQGFGTGLAYVSLTTVSFVTLPPMLRNEGTSFFNLMRNVGSSIGISSIQAYVTRGTSLAHERLAELITPYNLAATQPQVQSQLSSAVGRAALNGQVTAQASWIAYLHAFYLMMIITVLVIPLIALARNARPSADAPQVHLE